MKSRAAMLIALLITLASCGRGSPTPPARGVDATPTPPAEKTTEAVDAIRSGFALHGEQVGVGAIVRVRGADPRRDIDLDIAYYAEGRRLGAEQDTLAFCPPDVDCPWGQTFSGHTLGTEWRSIDEVRVTVNGSQRAAREAGIERLLTTVEDDSVVVRPIGVEGTAYVLVFDGDTPRFGLSFFTPREDRRALTYPLRSFPPGTADSFQTYFYRGKVPGSVYGPVD